MTSAPHLIFQHKISELHDQAFYNSSFNQPVISLPSHSDAMILSVGLTSNKNILQHCWAFHKPTYPCNR